MTHDKVRRLDSLKAGVIGIGNMGRNHARNYNELEEADLTCICDIDKARAEQISRIYKVPHFSSSEEMLESCRPDVVSIAVPTAHHYEMASLAISKGVGVLVEKPIDLSLERARSLVKMAREKEVPLMVGHIERFNPAVIKLKGMIDELGTPTIAFAERSGPLPNRVKDVGAIIDLGVHDLDVLRHILGSEVKRIYCECGNVIHKDHTDYAKLLLRFANGVAASMDVNWLTPLKIRRLIVQGLEARFEVDYIKQELYKYEVSYVKEFSDWSDILLGMTEGERDRIPVRKVEPLKTELQKFVEAVRDGKTPPVTGEDGLRALEIALLAEESGRTHSIMEL